MINNIGTKHKSFIIKVVSKTNYNYSASKLAAFALHIIPFNNGSLFAMAKVAMYNEVKINR